MNKSVSHEFDGSEMLNKLSHQQNELNQAKTQ